MINEKFDKIELMKHQDESNKEHTMEKHQDESNKEHTLKKHQDESNKKHTLKKQLDSLRQDFLENDKSFI